MCRVCVYLKKTIASAAAIDAVDTEEEETERRGMSAWFVETASVSIIRACGANFLKGSRSF